MAIDVRSLAAAVCVSLGCGPAGAEVPPLSQQRLEAEADLVVTGRVTAVAAKEVESTGDGFKETRHTLTVEAAKVGKGRLPAGARSVTAVGSSYVLPPGRSGTAGIRSDAYDYIGEVREGWELTLYLKAGRGGAYEIIAPNGFSTLRKPGGKKGK